MIDSSAATQSNVSPQMILDQLELAYLMNDVQMLESIRNDIVRLRVSTFEEQKGVQKCLAIIGDKIVEATSKYTAKLKLATVD